MQIDLGLIDSFVHAPVLQLFCANPSPLPLFHRFHNCHQHNDTVAVATVSLFFLSLTHTHKEKDAHSLDLRGLPRLLLFCKFFSPSSLYIYILKKKP